MQCQAQGAPFGQPNKRLASSERPSVMGFLSTCNVFQIMRCACGTELKCLDRLPTIPPMRKTRAFGFPGSRRALRRQEFQ